MSDSWRDDLVGDLEGDILEIGVGSGPNLARYRRASRICAIEPNAQRAESAQREAARLPIPVTLKTAPAECIPFDSASFDHVVSSLVFCSVDDPVTALREIQRVLKPGGTLHMVEHVRPQNAAMGLLFHALTPFWRRLASNCHLDRPTVETVRGAGWEVEVVRRKLVFVHLRATPSQPYAGA